MPIRKSFERALLQGTGAGNLVRIAERDLVKRAAEGGVVSPVAKTDLEKKEICPRKTSS